MKKWILTSSFVILIIVFIYAVYKYESDKADKIIFLEYKVDRIEKIIIQPYIEEPESPSKIKCFDWKGIRHGKNIRFEFIPGKTERNEKEKRIETFGT